MDTVLALLWQMLTSSGDHGIAAIAVICARPWVTYIFVALTMLLQVDALEASLTTRHPHWLGFCHNDLQCGNVMLNKAPPRLVCIARPATRTADMSISQARSAGKSQAQNERCLTAFLLHTLCCAAPSPGFGLSLTLAHTLTKLTALCWPKLKWTTPKRNGKKSLAYADLLSCDRS